MVINRFPAFSSRLMSKSCRVTRPFESTFSILKVRSSRRVPGIISARKVTFIFGRAQMRPGTLSSEYPLATDIFNRQLPQASYVLIYATTASAFPPGLHSRTCALAEPSVFEFPYRYCVPCDLTVSTSSLVNNIRNTLFALFFHLLTFCTKAPYIIRGCRLWPQRWRLR